MPEEKKSMSIPQSIILDDRSRLNISGVEDVDSFDEQTVNLFTSMGTLCVRGGNLHINKLSVETGEVMIEGDINSLAFTDNEQSRGGGLFSRLFR